jgi:hypothetical protein
MLWKQQQQQQQQDPTGLKALSPRQPRRDRRMEMMDTVSDQDHVPSGRSISIFGRATTQDVRRRNPRNEKQDTSIRRTVSNGSQYGRKNSPFGSTHRRKELVQERKTQERPKATSSTIAHRPDHSGDDSSTTYSFWSSNPALIMLFFLAMAVKYQNINFGAGALLVFLYQVGVVVAKWMGFIVNHSGVTECLELTKVWMKYSIRQAERLISEKDWTRKAALGVYISNFGTVTKVAGGYLKQRQEEVTKRTMAEVERIRDRLHTASS